MRSKDSDDSSPSYYHTDSDDSPIRLCTTNLKPSFVLSSVSIVGLRDLSKLLLVLVASGMAAAIRHQDGAIDS